MPIRRRPTVRLTPFLALLTFALAACATGPQVRGGPPLQTAALPAGFSDTLVAGLPKPTALATTPDGRLLIATQGGKLYVQKNGQLTLARTYRGANSARCNVPGRAAAGQTCQEIFASGLRNPFRLAFDPNAAGTRFFINDVGQNTREEVDEGQAGADYGWPRREGVCATGTADCGAPPAGLTNPVFDYAHTTGCRSISGGAFVPNGVWPSLYGGYLYADFVCGKIFRLTPSSGGYSVSTFADGFGPYSLVALTFLPAPGGQALYYTTYANGGQVRRISYTAP